MPKQSGKGKPRSKERKITRTARRAVRKTAATRAGAAEDKVLREHVLYLLKGGGAHVSFEQVIADFPPNLCGVKPEGSPFTAWRLLEHLRIAQWDILEFSRNS